MSDPFSDYFAAKRPARPPSVLDQFQGTELDSDPFGAFLAKRDRTAGIGLTGAARAIDKGLETIVSPIPAVVRGAKRFSNWITEPTLQDSLDEPAAPAPSGPAAARGTGYRPSQNAARLKGFVGGGAEAVGEMSSPLNIALTAADMGPIASGINAPIRAIRAGERLLPATSGAAARMSLQELAKLAKVGGGGFQSGVAGAQAEDALDRGDTTGAIIGGGMAAAGAVGALTGMQPGRFREVGEILPAEPARGGKTSVLPPDIDVYPQRRAAGLLTGDVIDAGADPITAFLEGNEPKRLYPPGLPGGESSGPAGGGSLQTDAQPRAPRPVSDDLAGGMEAAGQGRTAVPDDQAAARRQLQKDGFTPEMIDVLLGKLASGESETPGIGRAAGQSIPPGPESPIPLEDRMAAAAARKAARGTFDPVTSGAKSVDDELAAALGVEDQAPATAEFAFNQPDWDGGPDIKLYNIKGGPRDGSSVTADTLRELGMQVPDDVPAGVVAALPAGTKDRLRDLGYSEDRLQAMSLEQANAILGQNERRGPARVQTSDEDQLYARMREKLARGESTGSQGARDDFRRKLDADRSRTAAADARGEVPLPRDGEPGVDSADAALERAIAPDRDPERGLADAGGLEPARGNGDRPVRSEAPAGPRRRPETDALIEELIADARAQGYDGSDEQLRADLTGRANSATEYLDDLTQVRDENGPDALLREIRKLGGLRPFERDYVPGAPSPKMRGEFESMVAGFRNQGQSGASSIFRNSGLGYDDLVDQLRQNPAFAHLDQRQLEERLMNLAAGRREKGYELPPLEEAMRGAGVERGKPWWKAAAEGDDSFDVNAFEDLLATGEAQPRLPGAGAVRDVETATPEFDAPFSLQREAATRASVQPGLADLEQAIGLDDEPSPLDAIALRHEVRDPEKVAKLAASMKANGWQGRPALIVEKDGVQVAWTATHRLEAAKQAGLPDVPRVTVDGAALEKAGFDLDALTSEGKKARIAALEQTGQTEAAALLRDELPGSAARQNQPEGAARVDRVPRNVRDFLVKQLGYNDGDLDAMSTATLYKTARDRTIKEGYVRPTKRQPTVTRPEGESYNPTQLAGIDDDLETFLSGAQARVAQQAARRAELIKRQGVPLEQVNQPTTRNMPAPITPRDAIATRAAQRGNRAQEGKDATLAAARKGETTSQRQSRIATMQGEQRNAAKLMSAAFDDGNYKRFADLVGEAADRFWNRQRKMGTGDPGVRRSDGGDILEGGILPGFSMAGKVLKDPAKYAKLAAEMLRNPGIRALVGGLAGYATGDNSEDSLNRALQGAILAAIAPSGLRALKKAAILLRDGHAPQPYVDPKSQDISLWRLVYAPSPERTVPDLFLEAQTMMDKLQELYATPGLSTAAKVKAETFTKRELASFFREASAEAKDAGLKRRSWYANAIANRLSGKPTAGETVIRKFTDPIFGVDPKTNKPNLDPQLLERHGKMLTYRTLVGYGLDTAAQNLTQPVLSLLHVSPGNLRQGYAAARTAAGKKLLPDLRKATDVNEDLISEARQLAGKGDTRAARPGSIRDIINDPGKALRATDSFNRRVTYLAVLQREGKLRQALRTGEVDPDTHAMAMSIVRKTQGHQGPLGNNPFHKGPIAGNAASFQKFPGLFLENAVDAFNDPKTRGRAFVATMLGLVAVGQLSGISTEDLLVSGGRPLGIDIAHPMDTLRRGARVLPAGRGVADAVDHVTGKADHPFVAAPGEGFLDSDIATLLAGRYPVKATKAISETLREGLGQHAPETVRDTRPPHTGLEDLASLVGVKSTAQVAARDAGREASRFKRQAVEEATAASRQAYAQLERAMKSGDQSAITAARQKLSPAQLRAFDRSAGQTPYERRRSQIPKAKRDEFDQRFKDRLDR